MQGFVRFGVAVALLGAAAGAGFAIAATRSAAPGTVQALSACVHTGNSQLRLVSDASSCGSDTVVSWNATAGSAGTTPAANVGDVYATAIPTSGVAAGSFTDVATLSLPPGSFLITAKVGLVLFLFGSSADTSCSVHRATSNAVLDRSNESTTVAGPTATLALEAVATFATPTTVVLSCSSNMDVGIDQARLVALAVGKVNIQQPPNR